MKSRSVFSAVLVGLVVTLASTAFSERLAKERATAHFNLGLTQAESNDSAAYLMSL
jgi:hypothetical protein